MRILWYTLTNRLPVPLLPGVFPRDPENVRVAETYVGRWWVSTVFLRLDHKYDGEGPPVLFETMVFDHSGPPPDPALPLLERAMSSRWWSELYAERCCTWTEAEAQHERAVAWACERVPREQLLRLTHGEVMWPE